jgi:general secretion pathway protein G
LNNACLDASIERNITEDKSCFVGITRIEKPESLHQVTPSSGGSQISFRRIFKEQPSGFTLIELVLIIAILAVLASIAIPYYQDYKDRVNVAAAVNDIAAISTLISAYENDNRAFPDSLSDVGAGTKLDPWGNPYQYLNIATAKGKGKLRKDKSLNPINSDYDLYSMGKDGKSSTALTAKNSHDDVIRARDGKFVGLASDF